MTTQRPPRPNSQRVLSQDEINRMNPDQIAQAVAANRPAPREMEAKNIGDVIRKTDPITGIDYKQGTTIQIMKEAGVVPVWNLTTGLFTTVLKNLLPVKLSEYNELGQKLFSLYQSDVPEGLPHKNTYPCMLHEDHSLRPLAIKLGYGACKKMLRTQYDVLTHTKNRHRGAWDSFDRDKIEGEKTEERNWRHTSMEAMIAAALSSKPAEQLEKACEGCGESFFALNEESLHVKLNVHIRVCTPYIETFGAPAPADLAGTQWIGSNKPVDINPADYVEMSGLPQNIQAPTASDWPKTNIAADEANVGVHYSEFAQWCKKCGHTADGKTESGAKTSMRAHMKREHPDAD